MKEMAIGIHEWKQDMKQKYDLENFNDFTDKIDAGLNDFYHKRMSTRLIISNYLSIENTGHSIIDSDINIPHVINEAYEDAKLLCDTKYHVSPGIDIKNEFDGNFMYIKANLYYIIHELLKNSLEAVVIKHKCRSEMPKISIRVHENKGKPIIRIHDEGVGVSPENLNAIWSYFYSTSNSSIQNIHTKDELDEFIKTPKISGFGYGLPLCFMLMEHFDGKITFNSVVGSCSDVYLYF
jgi:signal transduction histidine kinase